MSFVYAVISAASAGTVVYVAADEPLMGLLVGLSVFMAIAAILAGVREIFTQNLKAGQED